MKKYTAIILMKVDVWTDKKENVKGIIENNVPYIGVFSNNGTIESRETIDIVDIH